MECGLQWKMFEVGGGGGVIKEPNLKQLKRGWVMAEIVCRGEESEDRT